MIPQRRLVDEALIANERTYADIAHTSQISSALAARYLLSDDYYAGLLPLPWRGRELYLPQISSGRLVESPSEIVAALNAYLAQPVITPTNALVTGYDFLIDEANAISATLRAAGLTDLRGLISNVWTDSDLRAQLLGPIAPALNSINSHFQHYRLFPTNPSGQMFATEITATTNYAGTLFFSVGCHSGLNVPDADSLNLRPAPIGRKPSSGAARR